MDENKDLELLTEGEIKILSGIANIMETSKRYTIMEKITNILVEHTDVNEIIVL